MKKVYFKFRILGIAALIIILGFLFNFFYTTQVLSNKQYTTVWNWDDDHDAPVFLTMSLSKKWAEQNLYTGGQYDFSIYNRTKSDITDWTIDMELPDDIHTIRDGNIWNVTYKQAAGRLHLESDEYTSVIQHDSFKTFGMILIGDGEFKPLPVTISYKLKASVFTQPLFTVLTFLAFIWCMYLVVCISEYVIKRKAADKERKDKEIILQSMSTFINFIDAKDPYTKGHSQRVATIAAELARRMGMTETEAEHLYYAGMLHDAGKIGVPDGILKKVGILTADEYRIIQQHSSIGGLMLSNFTSIEGIREAALYHHERYDGKGYPEGRNGKDIPLFGRIICVADTYDAMARDRCYRKHLSKEKILSEFMENSGTQFDPSIATFMIEMVKDGTAESITDGM